MTRGNKSHQLEPTQFEIEQAIQKHVSLAMRDGVMDEHERHLYDVLNNVKHSIGLHVNTDNFVAAVQKGVVTMHHLNQFAHVIGYHVSPHDPEPRGQVTAFPERKQQ